MTVAIFLSLKYDKILDPRYFFWLYKLNGSSYHLSFRDTAELLLDSILL